MPERVESILAWLIGGGGALAVGAWWRALRARRETLSDVESKELLVDSTRADGWAKSYEALAQQVKWLGDRLAQVSADLATALLEQDRWRTRAREAEQRVTELNAQIAELRLKVENLEQQQSRGSLTANK